MTQSDPSRMALATSPASALVGRGFFTIDSSIWVAQMIGFPALQYPFRYASIRSLPSSVADLDPSDPYVFWASWIRICWSEVTLRVRILISSSKNSEKTLIPSVLRLLFDLLSLKMVYMLLPKVTGINIFLKNWFFVGVLKVNDEKSRIRIH